MSAYPSSEALPSEARPIIERYSAICRAAYYEPLRGCVTALKDAATQLDQAAGYLQSLPIDSLQWSDTTEMPWMSNRSHDRVSIQRELRDHVSYCEGLALALQVAADSDKGDKKGQGVPEQVFIDATKELMTIYEETTGKVVYPDYRCCHQGLSTQDSTHFIAKCLAAIDPDCDLKMAVTCIKKARDWDKVPGTNLKMGDHHP
ncbi:MAG: hypothetical protein GC204_09350 [Chloroflexi bacterium]|nr:hypothetical protein [Chloroflexota bacterium]